MSRYHCILCAVDLNPENIQVLDGALRAAGGVVDHVHLIHVCEHPITGYGEAISSNHLVSEIRIKEGVYPRLESLAQHGGIPASHIHIEFGRPATVIHECAKNLNADLIVTGSHGKNGLQLLLGSTANAVVHGAHCDVLNIRIRPQ